MQIEREYICEKAIVNIKEHSKIYKYYAAVFHSLKAKV